MVQRIHRPTTRRFLLSRGVPPGAGGMLMSSGDAESTLTSR
jgi:hypothetical protein